MRRKLHKGKVMGRIIALVGVVLFIGITTGFGVRKNLRIEAKQSNDHENLGSNVEEETIGAEELIEGEETIEKEELIEEEDIKEDEEIVVQEEVVVQEDIVEEEIVEEVEQGHAIGKRLNVGLVTQLPELYNGCEVTSLAMLLNYKGIGVSKMELADKMIKDDTTMVQDDYGNIVLWGNPDVGFVGDVTGRYMGYSINPEPLIPLVNEYYSGGAVNLTGGTLDDLKASIDNDNPVLVWVSASFVMPVEYMSWKDSLGNEIWATMNIHNVLLTGYDEGNFYYNDPLSGYKDAAVDFQTFEAVWNELGRKAVTVS